MTIDFAKLRAPFPPELVSWRIGATNSDKTRGIALAYIDARDVMQRLDEVCGPENWQCDYPHANSKTVCRIGIRCGEEWIWKANGAGDTDVEAEKGALSDAFKRAAVLWGIGQYLYDLDSPWVLIKQQGRSYVIEPSELPRLRKLLDQGDMPARASSYSMKRDGGNGEWEVFQNTVDACGRLDLLERIKQRAQQTLFPHWPAGYVETANELLEKKENQLMEERAMQKEVA